MTFACFSRDLRRAVSRPTSTAGQESMESPQVGVAEVVRDVEFPLMPFLPNAR